MRIQEACTGASIHVLSNKALSTAALTPAAIHCLVPAAVVLVGPQSAAHQASPGGVKHGVGASNGACRKGTVAVSGARCCILPG
jgi:hypothetical protein